MPRKRKSGDEEDFTNSNNEISPKVEVYEKGGRVLRARETCMCPVCGAYFSPMEIQSHAQACLYILSILRFCFNPTLVNDHVDVKKKPKKSLSSSGNSSNGSPASLSPTSPTKDSLSKSDSSVTPDKKPTTPPRAKLVSTKWKPNTVAGWNIPYAPAFRPTVAEFKKPLEYIAKIRPIAEKYHSLLLYNYEVQFGILSPIALHLTTLQWKKDDRDEHIGDPKTFTFRTKVQNIHQLKTRWQGRNEVFVSNLASFLEKRGEPLRVLPRVDGRDLDLFKLFTAVVNRGGYQVVERANLWKSVADELKLSTICVRNNTLRNHYHKYLYDYELYRKSKLQFRPASIPSTNNNIDGNTNSNNADDDLYIAEDITGDLYNTDFMDEDSGDDEFGFYEGDEYTLSGFEKKARNFSEKWFPSRPTPEQVEEEFWRIVETAEDSVKVDYGSDLDVTKIQRSGFPRRGGKGEKPVGEGEEDVSYITEESTHWNLNRLPRMKGSVLSHIKETVAGVTDPMLYVGMLFSSFCWHTEDNYLYSINYMHKGTAKTWYGVPASAAERFEDVMKAAVPDLFLKHPDLLHLLITMISPAVLAENKVPIFRAVQEPGQYVITFPKAYHAGFSHGFTCAEAVNFAPADWLPYGYESVLHYRTLKRPSVFSHEELMFTIANRAATPETAFWLSGEFLKLREKEQSARDILRLAGFMVQIITATEPREEPKQCKVCNYDCFLSSVTCSCSPQYVGCLFHYNEPAKSVIDLTDDEASHVSLPNFTNLNNITTLPMATPPPPPPSIMLSKSAPNIRSPQKPSVPHTQANAQGISQGVSQKTQETQGISKDAQQSTKISSPIIASTPAATSITSPVVSLSPSPSSPPAADSSSAVPEAPKRKGIIINLNKSKEKPATSPYDNKVPPPPNISRTASSSNLNISSFTSFAAKQSQQQSSHSSQPPSYRGASRYPSPSPSPSPSSSPSPSPSSSSPSGKQYYYHHGYYPSEVEARDSPTPPSPTLTEHMQGIALNCPPSMAVHIVDSPTKA